MRSLPLAGAEPPQTGDAPSGEAGFFDATAKVRAWRHVLAQRPSVQQAVSPKYPALLRQFLLERRSELSRRMLSRSVI